MSGTIGLISKVRNFVPKYTVINIYQSFIAPYLSHYGLTARGQAYKSYNY